MTSKISLSSADAEVPENQGLLGTLADLFECGYQIEETRYEN